MAPLISEELAAINLGDKRLNDRSVKLLSALAENPQASIPAVCGGWAETQAAYRFFDQSRVDEEAVLAPHREATLRRMQQHPVVLLVQDTTELDYTRRRKVIHGAGPLNYENRVGFFQHVQLALTPEKVCLGAVDLTIWGRSFEQCGRHGRRVRKPIEAKESLRFLEGQRQAETLARRVPDATVISIADSEGDIYECFCEEWICPDDGPRQCQWIIRACEDRRLPQKAPERGPWCYYKLWETVTAAPVIATRTVDLPRTRKRQARQASLQVQACSVTLRPPYRPKQEQLSEVLVNAVLVREIEPPQNGDEPIEWMLLTTLPIETPAQVLRIVDYYVVRWQVEVFFRVLKTGCRVEQLQLEHEDRLKPALALYTIVSWRILHVTMQARQQPQQPCDELFDEAEWKAALYVAHGHPPDETPPPLSEFVALVARLGGHLGRTRDGPPGPQVLWIGMQKVIHYAEAWHLFGPGKH